MSHDRGCFICYEDPPYKSCKRNHCPQNNRGYWNPVNIEKRRQDEINRRIENLLSQRQSALKFWEV